MTKEIRETFKENEVILLLYTHMTKEIRETFNENEVILLLHTHTGLKKLGKHSKKMR